MRQKNSLRILIGLVVVTGLSLGLTQWLIQRYSYRLEEVSQVLQSGKRTQGQVTQVVWTSKTGDWVHYEFNVNGSEYTGKSPLGAMASPAVGQPIPVVYLPSDPHINTLANGEEADWLQHQIRGMRIQQFILFISGIGLVSYSLYLRRRLVQRN